MESVNWVANRAGCSIQRVFQILGEMVDTDVKEAEALNRRGVKFSLSKEVDTKLIVTRDRDLGGVSETDGVTFEVRAGKIRVTAGSKNMNERKPLFSFAPAFSQDGECLVQVEGESEPVKLWQVCRKALEDLFFGF
jgi:hypothetical protein